MTEANLLRERLVQAQTITGTRKLHQIIPVSRTEVAAKQFSLDTRSVKKKVVKYDTEPDIQIDDVNGYVTVMYEDNWWLGYVLDKNFNSGEVTVKFLHPHGPSPSFTFPPREDMLLVSLIDILTTVNASTVNGRTYTISKSEEKHVSELLVLKYYK